MSRFLSGLLSAALTLSLVGCAPAADMSPTPAVKPVPTAEPTPEPENPALTALGAQAIAEAERLALSYDYEAALERLDEATIANGEVDAKKADIPAAQASLVPFEGTIRHIFFHSLIIYPEGGLWLFTGDRRGSGRDSKGGRRPAR